MSEHRQAIRMGNRAAIICCLGFALVALETAGLAAVLTHQASVTLAWDRSPNDQLTNGVTYKVYAGTNLVSGNLVSITNAYAGTNTSVTFTNIAPAVWYFQATASQAGLESIPSNRAIFTVPSAPPAPPGTFAVIFLENSNVLTVTNWSDLGMFRARIYIP